MRRPDLTPDCRNCAALCCVATSFDASEDFAFDKPAGARCPYLSSSCTCAIHDQLVERGFRGCAIYDCHGAGQRVTRAFAGRNDDLGRNEAFLILREVHELLWLLTEAARICPASDRALGQELAREIETLDLCAAGPASAYAAIDLELHRQVARKLLRRLGEALGGRDSAKVALAGLRLPA